MIGTDGAGGGWIGATTAAEGINAGTAAATGGTKGGGEKGTGLMRAKREKYRERQCSRSPLSESTGALTPSIAKYQERQYFTSFGPREGSTN
jgi:hypothetical protein